MAVDWFLVDAPSVVPEEFSAWQDAKEKHRSIFLRACETLDGNAPFLDAEGLAAAEEAIRLEKIARDAWMRELRKRRGG